MSDTSRSREMLSEAVARCASTPERREMIYSPSYQRSGHLFSNKRPEGVGANMAQRTWVFPNGSTLQFASHDGLTERFAGCEYSYIEYDPDESYFNPFIVRKLRERVR